MTDNHISQMIQDLSKTKQLAIFAMYVQFERGLAEDARFHPVQGLGLKDALCMDRYSNDIPGQYRWRFFLGLHFYSGPGGLAYHRL